MIDMPPDPNVPLYTAIGVVVVQWAHVEISMDMCIHIIYHNFGGKTIIKRIPRTRLNEKITFLSTTLNDPALEQYKKEGLSLLDDVNTLSDHRHRIIHGAVIKMDQDIFHYTKLIYGDEFHKFDIYMYKLTDVVDYGKKIQDLAIRFASLRDRLIKDAALQKSGQQ